jgi:hypothetical protein
MDASIDISAEVGVGSAVGLCLVAALELVCAEEGSVRACLADCLASLDWRGPLERPRPDCGGRYSGSSESSSSSSFGTGRWSVSRWRFFPQTLSYACRWTAH